MIMLFYRRFFGNKNHGFSLLESVVAVVLISFVGILVAMLFQKNTMNLVWNRQARKAAALADMVFEKYDYLATISFTTLEQYNQSNTTPSSFFVTGTNNQGYDGMYITSVAAPTNSNGNRQVTVTICWSDCTPQKTLSFNKFVAPGTGTSGGAPVYVYVLDQNGVGVPGFEVHAAHEYLPTYVNNQGTNEVIGFTDTNGYVVLNGVSTDPTLQPMPIYARRIGSDAAIPQTSPNFVQGYYVSPNGAWNTKTVTVNLTGANTVTFDMRNNDFRPLASLNGTLTNVSGPVNNMQLNLSAYATSSSSNTIALPGLWTTYTSLTGYYEFNNIAPGAVNLFVLGHEGSAPSIPNTISPPFDQGYVGFGGTVSSAPWIRTMVMTDPAVSISSYTGATIRPLGWLNLTTVDSNTGSPVPNTTVNFTWPDIGYNDRNNRWSGTTSGTNGNVLQLWNMFACDNQSVKFSASVPANGCTTLGSSLSNWPYSVYANQVNSPALPMISGAEITGTVNDMVGNPMANVGVSIQGGGGGGLSATTNSSGGFTLCGVTASSSSIRTWPTVPFNLTGPNNGPMVSGTFSGTVVDANYPTQTVPGMTILPSGGGGGGGGGTYVHNVACASDPNPTNANNDTILSNSVGNYGPICEYIPAQSTVNQLVTGGPVVYSAGTLIFSTATMNGGLTIQTTYYTVNQSSRIVVANGGIYPGYFINATLIDQEVNGVIIDAKTSSGIPGLNFDLCTACSGHGGHQSCPVTTNASGNYGPVFTCISGRNNTSPGTVSVTVPNALVSTNGSAYSGASSTTTLPSPATPTTPLSINFSLTPLGGGI